LLTVAVLNAGSANAATYTSTINTTSALTFCPGTTAPCKASEGTVTAGTKVSMVCWQDPSSDHSHRYFYIQTKAGAEGFVHAGVVSAQTTTPVCTKVSSIDAASWALSQDGQKKVPANAKNGNTVTYWSGWCWLFAYDAWKLRAGHTPHYSGATAQATYSLYVSHKLMLRPTSSPPRGSLVFFKYGTIGHVAISLGDGRIETTQGNIGQTLTVTHMTIAQQGLTQLGYVPPSSV
jgi:surface antigen